MTEDLLVKQLLGRYSDNRLRTQTVINFHEEMSLSEEELRKLVDRQMATQLAEHIVSDSDLRTYVVQEKDPNYIGKKVEMETYCFSRIGIASLVHTAFQAGVESTKGSDRE